MASDHDVISQVRQSLDEVLPAAPWLETVVLDDFRRRIQPPAGPRTTRRTQPSRRGTSGFPVQLVAALLAVAIGLGAVAAFFALHQRLEPVRTQPIGFQVIPGGEGVCNSLSYPTGHYGAESAPVCAIDWPLFVSTDIGWVTESIPINADSSLSTNVLFRTDDGGKHWREQFTWTGTGPDVIRASADGKEAVASGLDSQNRLVLFNTTDSGADWHLSAIPSSAGRATQTTCKAGTCAQQVVQPSIDFVSARVGWLLSQEPNYSLVDLFQTVDSGAHWRLSAKADVQKFGLTIPNSTSDVSSNNPGMGQFVFQSTLTGWYFVPFAAPAVLYRTTDGGSSWQRQSLTLPPNVNPAQMTIWNLKSLNSTDAILNLGYEPTSSGTSSPYYISVTHDGGSNWAEPVTRPDASVFYIDAERWMAWPLRGGWLRTIDGGNHWEQLPANSLPSSPFGAPGAEFLDPLHGWAMTYAAGPGGFAIYQTHDGGVTWTGIGLPQVQPT